jgi:sialic acid synthase SpsE
MSTKQSKLFNLLQLNKGPAIISELGINHFGNLKIAKKMVDDIFKNGGRIIKNQSHDLQSEMSNEAKNIKPANAKVSIYDVIKKNMMSHQDEIHLKKYVEKKKMLYLSTPFSKESAKRLNNIGVKLFKIGSGEFNNLPLLSEIIKYNKPLILSTGMNDISSIKKTVFFLKKKKVDFALLHCVSDYPVKDNDLQLENIKFLQREFPSQIIGYSDHSKNLAPSIISMSFGALIVEKHYTLSKKLKGPDIICSMDSNGLREIILASKIYSQKKLKKRLITTNEKNVSKFAFASVVSLKNIKKGEILDESNIWVKRPGTGEFKSSDYFQLLGKKVKRNLKKNYQLKKRDV